MPPEKRKEIKKMEVASHVSKKKTGGGFSTCAWHNIRPYSLETGRQEPRWWEAAGALSVRV